METMYQVTIDNIYLSIIHMYCKCRSYLELKCHLVNYWLHKITIFMENFKNIKKFTFRLSHQTFLRVRRRTKQLFSHNPFFFSLAQQLMKLIFLNTLPIYSVRISWHWNKRQLDWTAFLSSVSATIAFSDRIIIRDSPTMYLLSHSVIVIKEMCQEISSIFAYLRKVPWISIKKTIADIITESANKVGFILKYVFRDRITLAQILHLHI